MLDPGMRRPCRANMNCIETIPGLVSTIVPVYNRARMVQEAVRSVLDQAYRPIELLLVNDGSTDDSGAVLDQLARAHPEAIRVIHKQNGGPGPAREAGRLAVRGEFIQYLDSDDWLLPGKFEMQVKALRDHPECGIAYGQSRFVDEAGDVIEQPSKRTGNRYDSLFPMLLVERWWHTHTPLYRRELSDAIGPWPAHRPEDWDWDARAGALRTRLIYCDAVLSCQRAHGGENRVSEGPRDAYDRDEAWFLPRLYQCALAAGVDAQGPEMWHFSRWAFALTRSLAMRGEGALAQEMVALARMAAPKPQWDVIMMAGTARLLGWTRAAGMAENLRRVFRRAPGRHTMPGSGW